MPTRRQINFIKDLFDQVGEDRAERVMTDLFGEPAPEAWELSVDEASQAISVLLEERLSVKPAPTQTMVMRKSSSKSPPKSIEMSLARFRKNLREAGKE